MLEIKIGKRTIPMTFTTFEMIAIQKEIGCTASQLRYEVFGIETDDEGEIRLNILDHPERMEKLGKLIRILGNAGLEESGQEADLNDKWILRNMKPAMILGYSIMTMAVINEGLATESGQFVKKDEETDEVLAEENAKKEPGN